MTAPLFAPLADWERQVWEAVRRHDFDALAHEIILSPRGS